MKRFIKNPFFYLSIILVILFGFQISKIALGLTEGSWYAAQKPPPLGQPAAPLDTSDISQWKMGNLNIGISGGESIIVNGKGSKILFKGNAAGIRLSSANKLEWSNNAGAGENALWTPFGEGGGGESVWKTTPSGAAYYEDGLVSVGVSPDKSPAYGFLRVGGPTGFSGGLTVFPSDNRVGVGSATKFWTDDDTNFYVTRGGSAGSSYDALRIDVFGRVTLVGGSGFGDPNSLLTIWSGDEGNFYMSHLKVEGNSTTIKDTPIAVGMNGNVNLGIGIGKGFQEKLNVGGNVVSTGLRIYRTAVDPSSYIAYTLLGGGKEVPGVGGTECEDRWGYMTGDSAGCHCPSAPSPYGSMKRNTGIDSAANPIFVCVAPNIDDPNN